MHVLESIPFKGFDPDRIYYHAEKGSYFVDVGNFYRPYTRKTPVKNGLRRYLQHNGKSPSDCKALIPMHMEMIELDQAIDWSGKIAGHLHGVTTTLGRKLLVTEGYNIPESEAGACPLHLSIIRQAFPEQEPSLIFSAWLQGAVQAVRDGIHQPAPMMVLAGEANAGKSLLAHLCKQAMGGRSSNPMTTWTGQLPWNDNLLGSELLLIDDSVASTDPRARKAFGARFKESIYAGNVEVNIRQKTSVSMRPVWRVMVCCNETPENLSVIPPLEEGIEDKIILLKVARVETPMPSKHPKEREAFQSSLKAELPAFLRWLEKVELPVHLTDSRSGVTAWKDSALYDAVMEISPEKRLERLLALAINKGFLQSGDWLSAAEIQGQLEDRDSPTSHQAKTLLKFDASAGKYLATLCKKSACNYVTKSKQIHGIAHYLIYNPEKE